MYWAVPFRSEFELGLRLSSLLAFCICGGVWRPQFHSIEVYVGHLVRVVVNSRGEETGYFRDKSNWCANILEHISSQRIYWSNVVRRGQGALLCNKNSKLLLIYITKPLD